MPFVNNEFVSEIGDGENFSYSPLSVGQQLNQLVDRNLSQYGDKKWITDVSTGKTKMYSDLKRETRLVASSLWKRGFTVNDRVLIMANNQVEFPIMFFGSWVAGGANITLTLNLLKEDIRERVEETSPKFVLVDELRAAKVVEALAGLECVREIFVIGQAEGCTPFDQLLEDDGQGLPEEMKIDTDSLAWVIYSSGTTGRSKAMVHTHRTLNVILPSEGHQVMSPFKFLFINPMVNSGGMTMTAMFSVAHAELYVVSKWSDEALLEAIDSVKPHVVSVFPSHIAFICKHDNLNKYDLSSIIVMVTVGSTINQIFEKEIFYKMPNMLILSVGYGTSETTGISSNGPRDLSGMIGLEREAIIAKHMIGCVGKLLPNVRAKIINRDTGANLGPGQVGEICIKSPFVMKGYLNQPKLTAEALIDGWYHTGDKAYFDENENLYIVGRYKELIKYRMAHVVPSNVEKHILTHPAVHDAGVVGLPHEVDGELPLAFVVVKDGCSVSEEEIVQYIAGRVMDEEQLRGGVRFLDKIPRNDLGKVVRPLLIQLLKPSETAAAHL